MDYLNGELLASLHASPSSQMKFGKKGFLLENGPNGFWVCLGSNHLGQNTKIEGHDMLHLIHQKKKKSLKIHARIQSTQITQKVVILPRLG